MRKSGILMPIFSLPSKYGIGTLGADAYKFIDFLKENEILSVFHYIPLHSSPAGQKYCKVASKMDITNKISDTLTRLPMFYELNDENLSKIKRVCAEFFNGII